MNKKKKKNYENLGFEKESAMVGVHTRFEAREKLPKRNGEIGLSDGIGNDES